MHPNFQRINPMSASDPTPTPPQQRPAEIESGMRTSQGDADDPAEALTIADKHGDEANDVLSAPPDTGEAVEEAAALLGDPDYKPDGDS